MGLWTREVTGLKAPLGRLQNGQRVQAPQVVRAVAQRFSPGTSGLCQVPHPQGTKPKCTFPTVCY